MEALVCKVLAHSSHDNTQHSIFPVLRQRHVSIQFITCHGLGIDSLSHTSILWLVKIVCALEGLPNCCLGTASGAKKHDGMTDVQQLLEVTSLVDKHLVVLQSSLLCHTDNFGLEALVHFGLNREAWKQIID